MELLKKYWLSIGAVALCMVLAAFHTAPVLFEIDTSTNVAVNIIPATSANTAAEKE